MRLDANQKIIKRAILCLLAGTVRFTVIAGIYMRIHYAAVMPRSPEPQTGRIYGTMAALEAKADVNKKEIHRRYAIDYNLGAASVLIMFLVYYLRIRLKWF
jgi:hypothetical protein